MGLALAASDVTGSSVALRIAGGSVLVAYAGLRTVRPIQFRPGLRTLGAILAEVAIHVLVVISTGYWESPYVFSLITAIVVAGFVSGLAFALRISVASVLAASIPSLLDPAVDVEVGLRNAAQWMVILALVAVVAGYARRLSTEAEERHILALDRLGRLAEANSLLYSLHQVAQAMPASLDLDEVLESTMERLRGLIGFTSAAILLYDDTGGDWLVARAEGVRPPPTLAPDELPAQLAHAAKRPGTVYVPYLAGAGQQGLSPIARSGLYAPLRARGTLIGLLAVEHHQAEQYSPREVDLLNGFVDPVALGIDNARWFARLRTVSADEERTRIARDLHDRVGQSLAYVAFELDRITRLPGVGAVGPDLTRLRQDLRTVIGEVRETLYDLRTDVSETQDLEGTVRPFLERVEARSKIATSFQRDGDGRLPLPQEREMWRIAQEAVTNAERHSGARRIIVTWQCDGEQGALQVRDDGTGVDPRKAGRMDSYGIIGMRERAASIGAHLDVDSTPGRGTTVRCRLVP